MKHLHSVLIILFAVSVASRPGPGLSAQEIPAEPEPESTSPDMPGPPPAAADAVSRVIRMVPNEKRALALKLDERNPYSRRALEVEVAELPEDGETEADRIREVLTNLPMSGGSFGERGPRVLAGDIIFERGKLVPPVLEDQTESLVVVEITEEAVVLGWIDSETGKPTGKRLNLAYDLRPVVKHVLHGQVGRDGKSEGRKFGIRRSGDAGQSPYVKRSGKADDVALRQQEESNGADAAANGTGQ